LTEVSSFKKHFVKSKVVPPQTSKKSHRNC
jgi:hypothetical protein